MRGDIEVEVEVRALQMYLHLFEVNGEVYPEDFWIIKYFPDEELKESDYDKATVPLDSLLSVAHTQDHSICFLTGWHGVGKSTLAALMFTSWFIRKRTISEAEQYDFVLVGSALELQEAPEDNIITAFMPLSSFIDANEVMNLMKRGKVLLLVDDSELLSEKTFLQLLAFVQVFRCACIIFLSSMELNFEIDSSLNFSPPLHFKLLGLTDEAVIHKAEAVFPHNEAPILRIKGNINRIHMPLQYPSLLATTFIILKNDVEDGFTEFYTASQLLWMNFQWMVQCALNAELDDDPLLYGSVQKWLYSLGEVSLLCLKSNCRLEGSSLEEFQVETRKCFPQKNELIKYFFKPRLSFVKYHLNGRLSSLSRIHLEFYASYYMLQQLLKKTSLQKLVLELGNVEKLILFMAGHMFRLQNDGSISLNEERTLIRTLTSFGPKTNENLSFILRFVGELQCLKRLVEVVVDFTEYPDEWNLNVNTLQLKPIQILLAHVSPTRIIILVENKVKNYELEDVVRFLCRVKISVWLDSASQFNYGNTKKLDSILKPFMNTDVRSKVDLISGSLSQSYVKELSLKIATAFLVLLKLKVTSQKALANLLIAVGTLENLLWLEVKIDFSLSDIDLASLPCASVPLFDIHLHDVSDKSVTFLSEFLSKIHNRYTGLHLENTLLTPECVFALLKELHKKGVCLHAEKEAIDKFRRWYYPALVSIPKWKVLTDAAVEDLLGFDDRIIYSDHAVYSNRFVTALDAWNLKNYLQEYEGIVYFVYEANNMRFTKTLQGDVETEKLKQYASPPASDSEESTDPV